MKNVGTLKNSVHNMVIYDKQADITLTTSSSPQHIQKYIVVFFPRKFRRSTINKREIVLLIASIQTVSVNNCIVFVCAYNCSNER